MPLPATPRRHEGALLGRVELNPTTSVLKRLLTRVLALTLAVTAGCTTTGERSASRRAEPHGAFSLLGIAAKESRPSPRAIAWNEWGDEHLRDGDILFVMGEGYILMGAVNFSKLSTDLTNGRFSHLGIVAIEEGRAVVYHMHHTGITRVPFGEMIAARRVHAAAVQRPESVAPQTRLAAVEYCRRVKQDQQPFDKNFRLDNDSLYCSEFVELAYRSAGFPLSEPVRLKDLPNYARYARQIQLAGAITSVEPEQLVYLPGNDDIGIWANPALELILDLPDSRVDPPQ